MSDRTVATGCEGRAPVVQSDNLSFSTLMEMQEQLRVLQEKVDLLLRLKSITGMLGPMGVLGLRLLGLSLYL